MSTSERRFGIDSVSGAGTNLSNSMHDLIDPKSGKSTHRHLPASNIYADMGGSSSKLNSRLDSRQRHYELSQQHVHEDYRQRSKSSTNPHHLSSSRNPLGYHYSSHHPIHDTQHHYPPGQLSASGRHSSKSRLSKNEIDPRAGSATGSVFPSDIEGDKHSKYHHQISGSHMYHVSNHHRDMSEASENRHRKIRDDEKMSKYHYGKSNDLKGK